MADKIEIQSWGSRIKNALAGILAGIVAIVLAIILTFWNERHGLHTALSLREAQQALIQVPNSPVNPQNDLRVVYLTGVATTQDHLVDQLLGLSVNAISLIRKVEMYQWKEEAKSRTEPQMGGSEKQVTSYSYKKVWSTTLIDSSSFNQPAHENPAAMPAQSRQQYAKTVTVGDFVLSDDLIRKISKTSPMELGKVDTAALAEKINKPVHLVDNQLYGGEDYQKPQIGDIRIEVMAIFPQAVSIIAQQHDNTLQGYMARAGETILLLVSGQQSADEMIQAALSENRVTTWLLRAASLFIMIIGFLLLLKPLVVLADVIPFLGTMVGFGTGLVALICGFSLWAIVTAIAWFATRPLWSAGLIIISLAIIYLLYRHRKNKATNLK
ncbi:MULTISPECIES: TMEM43 family protein [unclassified Legionella]|uniref:TMEM43 family protein n=1 Tax=unclassified Legionella TaxID=2622702 RepID=UPI0010560881|nr:MULTISPECIES: TMEM43 family protein [unclassified Legionella]MDI9819545.1 TMEM43 family protein [Legionella sp. PL877]